MTDNLSWLIELLEILFFLVGQALVVGAQRLVHTFDARETDDGTRDALVNPGEGDVCHLPALLLGDLLYSSNCLDIDLRGSSQALGLFGRSCCASGR